MKALKIAMGLLLVIEMFGCAGADSIGKKDGGAMYEEVTVKSPDGEETVAALFSVKSKRAVVFVPGIAYNKESWYFLAERFFRLKIASLSMDEKHPAEILGAIAFLKVKGFEKIALVGASLGGGSVLAALNENPDESVDKMVVLSPSYGNPVRSEKIEKFFIVAKNDSLGPYSYLCNKYYKDSSEPKMIKEYDSSEHGQGLFVSQHKEELIRMIISWIADE